MKIYYPIDIIIGILLLIVLVVLFRKSKTNSRRLVVILTGLAFTCLGLMFRRIESSDLAKNRVFKSNDLSIPDKAELINRLNFDLILIIYAGILCTVIIVIAYMVFSKEKPSIAKPKVH